MKMTTKRAQAEAAAKRLDDGIAALNEQYGPLQFEVFRSNMMTLPVLVEFPSGEGGYYQTPASAQDAIERYASIYLN